MKFPGKNLDVLKPAYLAAILLVFAIVGILGMSWPNNVLFTLGEFRFSIMSVAAILLAGGVLLDAAR